MAHATTRYFSVRLARYLMGKGVVVCSVTWHLCNNKCCLCNQYIQADWSTFRPDHSADTGMAQATTRYLSVRMARWLMEIIGFWNAQTIREQLRLRFNFAYMLLILVSSLCVELLDLYYSRHNLDAFTYAACSTIPVIVVLIKTITVSIRQKEVMWLIEHSQKHFWNKKYDHFERNALHQLDKRAVLIMLSFTILINATTVIYGVAPLVENIGKSAADRILPFTFNWFGLPISTTPLYEMLFVLEMVLATHVGVYFCCFDNFFCILCMHISEQFKILQHRVETLLARDSFKQNADKTYDELKHCVARHRLLILYVEKLECTFRYSIMSQLLISSVVLCISGFQLCLEHKPLMKRLLFATYFVGGIFQIFLITFNSNNIMVQSDAVGNAVYNCNWEASSYKRYKKLRKHLLIIMARSKRPCYLSAGKFFPVSLESFMKVISTTASYFALLRELDIDSEEQ